ncbi:hypothetical protein D3C71_1574640 [compost metagenome]
MRPARHQPNGAIACGALPYQRCDLCDLSGASIERHGLYIIHGCLKPDQCDVIHFGQERVDPGGISRRQGLFTQGLRHSPVAGMQEHALHAVVPSIDGDCGSHPLHRCGMRCGHHPLRGNEHAMALARHVCQCGKNGPFDSIPRIVNVIADDDGLCSERERGKYQKEPAIHRSLHPCGQWLQPSRTHPDLGGHATERRSHRRRDSDSA